MLESKNTHEIRLPSVASSGKWSIVSTMRSTPELVAAFVAHHMQTEALGIHIYLDEADPEVEALLAPLAPRVITRVCDAAYWAGTPFGKRPDLIVRRQVFNAGDARKTTEAGWLVHIDSDEFLQQTEQDGATTLGAELAAVPGDIHWARIGHLERVFERDTQPVSIFDGVFRRRIGNHEVVEEIYGVGSSFLRFGYSGYFVGKTATRVNSQVQMHLHGTLWPGQKGKVPDTERPPFVVLAGTQLLHFDGLTPLQWIAKLLRRVDNNRVDDGCKARRAQMHFMKDATSVAERLSLFELIQTLPRDKIEHLLKIGLMTDRPFDPSPAIAKVFPDRQFSFLIADFDAGLRRNDPDFFIRHGLT
ncbi:MAG: glycosyltransferase family 2 protein [Alphaproteobacteria bacterium]